MNASVRCHWCECCTEDVTSAEERTRLASFDAYSVEQANLWVSIILLAISPVLDSDASDEPWA